MRHADQHVPQPAVVAAVDDGVEDRHEHVEAFDREARLAGERAVQEALEGLDLGDPIEQRLFVDGRHGRTEAARLDGDSQPLTLFGDEDLREVVAGARAVGAPQRGYGRGGIGLALGQRSADDAGRKLPQLLLGDAVALGGEHRVTGRPRPQRVDLGAEVPVPPNPLGQRRGADHGPKVDRARSPAGAATGDWSGGVHCSK